MPAQSGSSHLSIRFFIKIRYRAFEVGNGELAALEVVDTVGVSVEW